jgi:CubicO group peptidase (beta-lactamase class C family)
MCAKYVLCLLVVFCFNAYASEPETSLVGIWHTEVEAAGLHAALEFEVALGPTNSEWEGRWEMLELTSWGPLQRVHIEGSTVEVDINGGTKFRGDLAADGKTLQGVLHFQSNKRAVNFLKVDDWATRMPARIDDQGRSVESWTYQPPVRLDDGWTVAVPNMEEIQDLDELFQKVVDGRYQGLDAVLVARNGQLVLEEYFHFGNRDEIHTLQSVTKSVTSLLLGIAHDDGLIADMDDPIYRYFSHYPDSKWVKDKHPISLKHALTMSAGLNWDEQSFPYTDSRNDNRRMNLSGDMVGYVLSRELAQDKRPGDEFVYTSGLSILLGGVIQEATGMRIEQYAEQTLFEKMGIGHYYWSVISGQVHTGGGLYLRARDLLKLGQLVLDEGRWNGEQVISAEWIQDSTAFHLSRPAAGRESGYGYQWWLRALYTARGSVPVIYASGLGGQKLWVFPKLRMVMIVLHHNPRPGEGRHTMDLGEVAEFVIPALASSKLKGFCLFTICF